MLDIGNISYAVPDLDRILNTLTASPLLLHYPPPFLRDPQSLRTGTFRINAPVSGVLREMQMRGMIESCTVTECAGPPGPG
eukprot:426046-Hanusia_phi.AAC.1